MAGADRKAGAGGGGGVDTTARQRPRRQPQFSGYTEDNIHKPPGAIPGVFSSQILTSHSKNHQILL
jgi:hypothetical protein